MKRGYMRYSAIATVTLSLMAFDVSALAQTTLPSTIQTGQVSNIETGDVLLNITNTGISGGDVCANMYVLDPHQIVVACGACLIGPGGIGAYSVLADLISDTLTPGIPINISVSIVTSEGGNCNAATVAQKDLRTGLSPVFELPPPPAMSGASFTPFKTTTLRPTEFEKLTQMCGFTQILGEGFGSTQSCRQGNAIGPTGHPDIKYSTFTIPLP